jgi:hypothetical protein
MEANRTEESEVKSCIRDCKKEDNTVQIFRMCEGFENSAQGEVGDYY